MKRHINDSKHRFIVLWGNAVLLFVVIFVSAVSLFFVHKVLMENAQSMGEEIANSYSVEEEYNLEVYQSLLTIGAQYIEGFAENGEDEEFIDTWIKDYLIRVSEVAGEDTVNTYAVINGMTIAARPWENIEEYNAMEKEWYQRTVGAHGEIVFTDVYTDTVYDKPVITIAKECGDSGNVIALDIYPENFRIRTNTQDLPEGSFYFLCDSKGNLLYEENDSDMDRDVLEKEFRSLIDEISEGSFRGDNDYYFDADGKEMSVYYREGANGWISIFLIPNSYLLENWERVTILYIGLLLLIFAVFIFMWIRQRQIDKERRRINETVHILGNSYYAFYRININKGTYEMTKGSEYVRSRLPLYGNYRDLLNVFQDVIAEDTFTEFKESFSLENIHRQIENRVEDFGGDFLRLFGDEWKWVNVHIMFSPSLNKEEAVLCFRHVEEEKQRQLKHMTLLEESLRAANASSRSQKKFFAGISHDMRTPLNVIINLSEMAEENIEDQSKVKEYLSKINYSSKQLLELINHILEMSRVEQGPKDGENFDLCENLKQSVGMFEAQAEKEKKKIDLTCTIRHKEVFGNRIQLEHIMNNLVSNALQYTRPGDHISVELKEIENQKYSKYQIVVSDNGMGMNREFQERIYRPNKREKRFGTRSTEETGMGMMIVKNLVSLMGGEIDVESILGKGTRITIILPLDTVEPPSQPQEEETEKKEKPDCCLEGKKILLAEDYELNMELATDILEMRGVEVVQAWNGKEALEVFEASDEFSFDAVLMDMQMPVMDGCEAAKAIRALKRRDAAAIPIVAVTANAFSEDIARTIKSGMDAHIAKPIDFEILSSTLMDLWDRKSNCGGS